MYVISLIQRVKSLLSIDEAFYSLKWAHELAGIKDNICSSFMVKSVREAAHRILGHSAYKNENITPEILGN